MRCIMIGILGAALLAVAGCGGGKTFANRPRPAAPVNLTVYVNDSRVSVSPASVGAGPVLLIVTNQASKAESLQIQSAGAATSLADTGPINPQAASEVKVDLQQGDYTVGTDNGAGGTDASQASSRSIQSAHLHIGPPRSGEVSLLQP